MAGLPIVDEGEIVLSLGEDAYLMQAPHRNKHMPFCGGQIIRSGCG